MRDLESKWIPFDRLTSLAAKLHSEKRQIVTTNGCFDILHWGHIKYLRDARQLGDVLICGVNSDRSVKKLKGQNRPLYEEKFRALQIAALESVDYVTLFNEDTPEQFLKCVRPAIHVKGGDYAGRELPERKCVEEYGGKIICLPFVEGFSTSRLLKLLSDK